MTVKLDDGDAPAITAKLSSLPKPESERVSRLNRRGMGGGG